MTFSKKWQVILNSCCIRKSRI